MTIRLALRCLLPAITLPEERCQVRQETRDHELIGVHFGVLCDEFFGACEALAKRRFRLGGMSQRGMDAAELVEGFAQGLQVGRCVAVEFEILLEDRLDGTFLLGTDLTLALGRTQDQHGGDIHRLFQPVQGGDAVLLAPA